MGLPGTGKSAVAEGIARALGIPVFSVDPLEAALLRCGITREHGSGYAAYELAATLARSQLTLGQSVIVDAVNGKELVRAWWRELEAEFGVTRFLIECTCSDRTLHRLRLESRRRDLPGFIYEPSWAEVEAIKAEIDPCDEERLILDAVEPLDGNIARAVTYVGSGR
jgi:predicted kinase